MCRADRHCIGDLSRYKSHISNDLNNVKMYDEKFWKILEKYKIIKKHKRNNQTITNKIKQIERKNKGKILENLSIHPFLLCRNIENLGE